MDFDFIDFNKENLIALVFLVIVNLIFFFVTPFFTLDPNTILFLFLLLFGSFSIYFGYYFTKESHYGLQTTVKLGFTFAVVGFVLKLVLNPLQQTETFFIGGILLGVKSFILALFYLAFFTGFCLVGHVIAKWKTNH